MHDIIGCYLDLEKSQISFSKNGADPVVDAIYFLWLFSANINERNFFFHLFHFKGNDLGVAFDIPQNLKNQPFFASCVLKVWHQYKIEKKPIAIMFIPYNCPNACICNRMQSWSSTLEEKTLNTPLRVGLLPSTRHQMIILSSLLRQVRGCNGRYKVQDVLLFIHYWLHQHQGNWWSV